MSVDSDPTWVLTPQEASVVATKNLTPVQIGWLCVILALMVKGARPHKVLGAEGFHSVPCQLLGRAFRRTAAAALLFEVRSSWSISDHTTKAFRPLADPAALLELLLPRAQYRTREATSLPASLSPTHTIHLEPSDTDPTAPLSTCDRALVGRALATGTVTYRRKGGTGRLYADGGLQSVSSQGKALLFRGTRFIDLDMVSAHLTLLRYLVGTGVSSVLDGYHDGSVPRTKESKIDLLSLTNGRRTAQTPVGKIYKDEMVSIVRRLRETGAVKGVLRRGTMFRLLEILEDEVLGVIRHAARSLGCVEKVLMFDGLILDPRGTDHDTVVRVLESAVEAAFPGMGMRLAVKHVF